jgi:hypothetical protein
MVFKKDESHLTFYRFMFYPGNDDGETTSSSRGTTMKKCTFLLSTLIGIILFACGSSGTGDTGSTSYNASDYFNKDQNKTYTYSVSTDLTNGQQQASKTETWVYSYGQTSTIPSKYSYSDTIAGPYIIETLSMDNTIRTTTYISSSGTQIISDDSGIYTTIDNGHSTFTGNMPSEIAIGGKYTLSSMEDLLNSDPNQGTVGGNIGTKNTTEHTINILAAENITVTAGSFETLKTQDTSTTIITTSSGTKTIKSSSSAWYGKGIGLVKTVSNNTYTTSDGTLTSSVTSELISVSP